MNKVKHAANLLLVLFSPVILVVVARAMHTVCMWALAGIVLPQEAWYFAMLLTILSFTVAGVYAFCKWLDQ